MIFYFRLVVLWLSISISYADNLLGLPPLVIPIDNPQSAEKISLGKQLFNDVRLSADGTVSCASCHQDNKGLTDGLKVAQGIKQLTGFRNAPTVINAAFYKTLFHDGRAKSLEEQALGPFLSPVEHGLKNKAALVALVKQDSDYQQQFSRVFQQPDAITIKTITQAIASFERTLIAGNSKFDRYLFGRDHTQLSESEARGMRLFRRKGNCANCHEITGKDALFMDNRFYNLGVGSSLINDELADFVKSLRQGDRLADYDFSAAQKAALGRFVVTNVIADIGKFKTPTVRNIALTAPYMHDGSLQTLEEVVEYYNKGGEKNAFLDAAIFPLHFTEQEKQDLVAFLNALTSKAYVQ